MKKLWLFFFIISGMYNGVYAQSKSIKVLLQQIAALQVYIDVAQKGYSIAQKGLNAAETTVNIPIIGLIKFAEAAIPFLMSP